MNQKEDKEKGQIFFTIIIAKYFGKCQSQNWESQKSQKV